jgi:hypothetical protein
MLPSLAALPIRCGVAVGKRTKAEAVINLDTLPDDLLLRVLEELVDDTLSVCAAAEALQNAKNTTAWAFIAERFQLPPKASPDVTWREHVLFWCAKLQFSRDEPAYALFRLESRLKEEMESGNTAGYVWIYQNSPIPPTTVFMSVLEYNCSKTRNLEILEFQLSRHESADQLQQWLRAALNFCLDSFAAQGYGNPVDSFDAQGYGNPVDLIVFVSSRLVDRRNILETDSSRRVAANAGQEALEQHVNQLVATAITDVYAQLVYRNPVQTEKYKAFVLELLRSLQTVLPPTDESVAWFVRGALSIPAFDLADAMLEIRMLPYNRLAPLRIYFQRNSEVIKWIDGLRMRYDH